MINIKPYDKLKKEYEKTILTRKRINTTLKFSREKEIAYEWLFFIFLYIIWKLFRNIIFMNFKR